MPCAGMNACVTERSVGYAMSRNKGADGGRRNLLQRVFGAVLGVFTSLITAIRGWVGRRSARDVKVNVGGNPLEMNRITQKDQERITSEWLQRHTGAEGRVVDAAIHQAKRTEHAAQEAGFGQQSAAPVQVPPATYDELVRSAFAELVKPGRLLFNPPDRMKLGHTERVEVRLARTLEMDAELLVQLHGHGKPQLEEIPTAPRMAVTLKGDGFRIKAYSDEEQAVIQDGITIWEFDIYAIERGQQRLVICVSLRIPVPGQPSEHKSIPVREATINVQVGVPALVGHFVSGNWQWFIGTAIAIAAVLVAVLVH
jgi:hypothetical protein